MSTVKANSHQVGQSVTAANNFTLYQPSTPDGTVRLGVGNAGATTTDVITASATGVTIPSVSSNNTFGFKNRIINGGMVIDQRNAGASVTVTNTSTATYTLDRWQSYGSAASKFSVQQNAGSVTPPVGFKNYLGVTSLASTSVGSSDQYYVGQYIEGYNIADMGFGAAGASTFTISFWVRSSLTGTFGGSVANSAFNRSYPFSYTISAANTWEQKTVTIAGDTSGTWLSTNGIGLQVNFGIGVGASLSGTANSWASAAYVSATGATSVVGTNGATFYITGVQLEIGSQATSFDFRSYGQELALCQRYYQILAQGNNVNSGCGVYYNSGTFYISGSIPVTMRSSPSLVSTSGSGYYVAYSNSTGLALNSFTATAFLSNQCYEMYNNTQASGTSGAAGFMRTSNNSSLIAFSSEL